MIRGIGIDIVEHDRINLEVVKKICTEEELLIYQTKKSDKLRIEYIASRFAAKEAIIKATNKKYTLKEIELSNDKNGKIKSNIKNIKISIAHEEHYSVAIAILEE